MSFKPPGVLQKLNAAWARSSPRKLQIGEINYYSGLDCLYVGLSDRIKDFPHAPTTSSQQIYYEKGLVS
jgi:hypothetical protein